MAKKLVTYGIKTHDQLANMVREFTGESTIDLEFMLDFLKNADEAPVQLTFSKASQQWSARFNHTYCVPSYADTPLHVLLKLAGRYIMTVKGKSANI